jgi:hypothetical protein
MPRKPVKKSRARKKSRKKSRKKYIYPYAKNNLFYLNAKSNGSRITPNLIKKYPNAFDPKLGSSSISEAVFKKSRKLRTVKKKEE